MDEDEQLYREMNPEDPWYMGDRDEDYDDEEGSEEESPQEGAYILYWDPNNSSYTAKDFARDYEKFGNSFCMSWTIFNNVEYIREGDKYYMIRIGKKPGMIWHGEFTSAPYYDEKDEQYYADIVCRDMVAPGEEPMLTLEEMIVGHGDFDWYSLLCGDYMRLYSAKEFRDQWLRKRWKKKFPYKGFRNKEEYEAHEKAENRKFITEVLTMLVSIGFIILALVVACS